MPEFSEAVAPTFKYIPWMAILIAVSGFFSGSEAAFFSLSLSQRRSLKKSSGSALALSLLERPERLLMGILFWNLAINLAYFTLASKAALAVGDSSSLAAGVTLGALLAIIMFGEFVPKSFAVGKPLLFIRFVSVPLTVAIRILDACLPAIKLVSEFSRRLVWPGLKPEPYLELEDLDRAVASPSEESELFEHERGVLRNIIRLSEIRVEEWMRPRTQFLTFRPPVSLADLGGQKTPSGHMLITDAEGKEVVSAVDLSRLRPEDSEDISSKAQPLVVVPWCATIADALRKLTETRRRVAIVVNELGESIGILTWDELFEAILQIDGSTQRNLTSAEVSLTEDGSWLATGMTKLRKLERVIGQRLEIAGPQTVGGVMQESLRRLPEPGDECVVGTLHFEFVETNESGESVIRVRSIEATSGSEQTE